MILDLEDPRRPREVGRWWMPGQWVAGGETPAWSGRAHRCHHPIRLGTRLYVSYWHGGFVILDIEDPATPRLVSRLDWSPPFPAPTHTTLPIPFPLRGRRVLVVPEGQERVCSNDVCVDARGLIYLIDRGRGLHILERV